MNKGRDIPAPRPALQEGPRPLRHVLWLGGFLVFLAVAVLLLDWDLSRLATPVGRSQAWDRLHNFVGGMTSPDLDPEYLWLCARWAHETVTTALGGMVIGMLLGWLLALGASRTFVLGEAPSRPTLLVRVFRTIQWVGMECCRLLLDALRGVPDFVWAIVLIPAIGTGRLTGTIAIGLGVAGILGKIYSELWDAVPARRLEPLRTMGAGRMGVHMYGTQPLTVRAMVSFTLMRTECAIRNASVLGVVIGGGLGGAVDDELSNGDYARVGTVVMSIFLVTTAADLISNVLRRQFRNDPNHPRVSRGTPRKQLAATWAGIAMAVAVFGWSVADHFIPKQLANTNMIVSSGFSQPSRSDVGRAIDEIRSAGDYDWLGTVVDRYFSPDFGWSTVKAALASVVTPVSVALVATLLAVLGAMVLAWFGSVAYQIEPHRFTGERSRRARALLTAKRGFRWTLFGLAKMVALVSRSVPEVLWAIILIRLFSLGTIPGVLAIAIHSTGVLARVFTETVDNVPYRRLEQTFLGSRRVSYMGVAVPVCWREWMTYSFFQFESNVRMGVVLGLVGLSGLGMSFHEAKEWAIWGQASTLLITMILLTTVIDRISRALKISRATR